MYELKEGVAAMLICLFCLLCCYKSPYTIKVRLVEEDEFCDLVHPNLYGVI